MKQCRWIVMDTGCVDCGVDIVGGFSTERKATAIASLLNRNFKDGRLDIYDAQCIKGEGHHLFSVFEMPEREHMNSKYS